MPLASRRREGFAAVYRTGEYDAGSPNDVPTCCSAKPAPATDLFKKLPVSFKTRRAAVD